ncbi:hypothetical protein GCM10010464_60720 [Pseudonocardia yunnanensis]|uniref:SRPBCC domain-containing protein n=1 Tax=Pseudonocardia yunnanensis TaxID=58107 RepID=A0ABW4EN59_9PSEU
MGTIHLEVWINADRKSVFEAITSKDGLDAWWGTVLTAAPEIGSVVEFDHGHGDLLRMRIVDLVPGEWVEWRCLSDFHDPTNPASDWLGHRFTFALRTVRRDRVGSLLAPLVTGEEFTVLEFRQEGWSSDARWYAFCNCAWGETLGVNLKNHCEAVA